MLDPNARSRSSAVARPFLAADPFGSPRSQTLFTMSKTPAQVSPDRHHPEGQRRISLNDLCRELREARRLLAKRHSQTRDLLKTLAQQLVEANGIEPMTSCLQSTRSPN